MSDLALRMLMHAVAAAVIFFLFQRYAINSTLETSALWAAAGAVGAAILARSQHRRGD
jgi:predicted NBD/HSP70 family sugar kinase